MDAAAEAAAVVVEAVAAVVVVVVVVEMATALAMLPTRAGVGTVGSKAPPASVAAAIVPRALHALW